MDKKKKSFSIEIDRVDKSHDIPHTIVSQIVLLISNGQLNPGDRLPSELEMTRRFGVSRISLREAMKLLEAKGYIESQGRKGKVIKPIFDNVLGGVIADIISIDSQKAAELIEVLSAVVVQSGFLAASKASDEQIKKIIDFTSGLYEKYKVSPCGSAEVKTILIQFYNHLSECCNNTILSHLLLSLNKSVVEVLFKYTSHLDALTEQFDLLTGHFVDIARSIQARDVGQTRRLVTSHFSFITGQFQISAGK